MENLQRFVNPWLLHLQKFGLELKCPLCLNLLNQPVLLPCNHIFCNFCIPRATQFGSECPTCRHLFPEREIRPAPYMDNMINIYRSLDVSINASLTQPASPDAAKESVDHHVSTKTQAEAKLQKDHFEVKKPSNGPSVISLTANKRAYASLDACIEDEIGFNSGEKLMNLLLPLEERNEIQDPIGSEEIAASQMEQMLSLSPPSSGDTKVTGGSNDLGSHTNSVEKSSAKRVLDDDLNKVGEDVDTRCTGDLKRQKNLDNSFNNQEPLFCKQSTHNLELPNENEGVCVFCFTSEQSDGTGRMLHYENGKEVTREAITFSNVLHVHEECVNWAPQVYYKGLEIKNLKSELARAAKLKCSNCERKGAAVGCYVKNCKRSYHLPCALSLDCRWDDNDFLMLCPNHSSSKFPRENSRSRKRASGTNKLELNQMNPKNQILEVESFLPQKEWVFCGSALNVEDKKCLISFASCCGATISRNWSANVTHVIAATDENGACTRTLKVLMASLNGKWILTMDWIKACVEADKLVCEDPYEVKLDTHGCKGGPTAGRLRALQKSEKLFSGIKFYFVGEFLEAYKTDLISLIKTGGGKIIQNEDELLNTNIYSDMTKSVYIVYNDDDSTPENVFEEDDGSIGITRLLKAETLATEVNASISTPSSILSSIAACNLELLTFDPRL